MSSVRQVLNKWDPRSPVLEVAAPARSSAPALPFRPAPVRGAPAPPPAAVQALAGATVSVRLLECGNAKIHSIKEARTLTGLGLKEAKDLVETAPVVLKSGLSRAVAEAAVARLLQAGAVADLLPDP